MRNAAIAIVLMALMSGCAAYRATEKNFLRFHEENDSLAEYHCGRWKPITEKVITRLIKKEGKPYPVPGEIQYVNVPCDSAYRAAYDEAIRLGQKGRIVVPSIRIKLPPQMMRVDTQDILKEITQENTHLVKGLQYKLNQANIATEKANAKLEKETEVKKKYRRIATWEGSILFLVAAGACTYKYMKIKAKAGIA